MKTPFSPSRPAAPGPASSAPSAGPVRRWTSGHARGDGRGRRLDVIALILCALLSTPALAKRSPPPPAPVASAGALVDNVAGITLDGDGHVVRFTGLLLTPDGTVVRLLKAGEKRPERLDWRADMKGRVLLPGFVDSHGHLMDLGFRLLELDLSGTHSLAEAQARIRAYAAANPDHKWILGGGWNQEEWGLGRFPTNADLDAAVGDRPVALTRVDSHAVWMNSAAIRAAGVTAATRAPAGGRIERGPGGQPSGIFTDAAREMVMRATPAPRAVDRDNALLAAQEQLLARGVTATDDMRTTLPDWLTFRRAGDRGALRLRVEGYADSIETANLTAGSGPSPWLYGDRLRLIGVKIFADGALGSRGAWLKAPYSDAPRESGQGFWTDDQLRNLMSRAAMDHFQVAVHAIGDRANAEVIGAIAELSETYKGDRRWRIEHAQVIDPADMARLGGPGMQKGGVVAAMQPIHQVSDRLMAEARLGPARLAGAYAWASVARAGATLAFGSDYPNDDFSPFHGWAAAVTRQDAAGDPPGGWQPQERLGREAAWRAYTTDAAYAGFAEKVYGRLAPGQRADFIIVDRDPLTVTPAELRDSKVEETWIGGEKVWDAGRAKALSARRELSPRPDDDG